MRACVCVSVCACICLSGCLCASMYVCIDYQKLEREARICRMLKHPTIGELFVDHSIQYFSLTHIFVSLKCEK